MIKVYFENIIYPTYNAPRHCDSRDGRPQAFPSEDPMDQPDFDPVKLINDTFPNEQVLLWRHTTHSMAR